MPDWIDSGVEIVVKITMNHGLLYVLNLSLSKKQYGWQSALLCHYRDANVNLCLNGGFSSEFVTNMDVEDCLDSYRLC